MKKRNPKVFQSRQICIFGGPSHRWIHTKIFMGQHDSHSLGITTVLPQLRLALLDVGIHPHNTVAGFTQNNDAFNDSALDLSVLQEPLSPGIAQV